MTASRAERVRPGHRDRVGESPLWNAAERALYWVDIEACAIRRLRLDADALDSWTLPERVACIALHADGGLVAGLETRLVHAALGDDGAVTLATLAPARHERPDMRFNDGRCDRQGRFWVGSMHNITCAPEGVLYCLDGRSLRAVRSGICIPNSLAFSPDGATMYFADSLRHALYAYDYDGLRGVPGPERVLAVTEPPAFPDGSTVDAEGFLWNAEFNGARLVRYAPDGRIDRVLPLPVQRPTCCAFGGPGLDVLYVTTASQKMTPEELRAQPLAGALLALDVGVRGLPEPRFVLNPSPSGAVKS